MKGKERIKFAKITVGGFKNIRKVDIELEQVTAFIAVNNYGKSNVMEALDFGFLFLHSSALQREAMMHSLLAPKNESFYNAPYFLTIEGSCEVKNYKSFRYSFGFDWERGKVNLEKLEFLHENSRNQFKTVLDRHGAANKYIYNTQVEQNNKKITKIDDNELLIDKIREDEVDYYNVIRYIKNSRYCYCKDIDSTSQYLEKSIYMENEFFASVHEKLDKLKEKDLEKYNEFEFVLKQLFPDIKKISIQKTPAFDKETMKKLEEALSKNGGSKNSRLQIAKKRYMMSIQQNNIIEPLNINQMSNGFRRVIWLLLKILEADDSDIKILAIEELETGIHQKLLRSLLEKIYEWIEGDLILLISTHSVELASYLIKKQLVIGIPNDNAEAKFIQLDEREYRKISREAQLQNTKKADFIFDLITNTEDLALHKYLGIR